MHRFTVLRTVRSLRASRALSTSAPRFAQTIFNMPSLSPTMEEGKIGTWRFKEGEEFNEGDIIVSVETDKAEVEVEAQEEGRMGKVLVPDHAEGIKVGRPIAILVGKGESIDNLTVPTEAAPETPAPSDAPTSSASSKPSSSPPPPSTTPSDKSTSTHHAPTHPRPLPPSVERLLSLNGIEDAGKTIGLGSGKNGRLTKEDVLKFVSTGEKPSTVVKKEEKKEVKQEEKKVEAWDGAAFRRAIASGLAAKDVKPRKSSGLTFDSILKDYATPKVQKQKTV